ncbi:MAG: hypothetical protein L0211_17760 [Planctomycetaceae bacterium]|nr:hypothetical protein [Planctomycetaceae bacterium]
MIRTFVRSALTLVVLAGASCACQIASAEDAYCENCPGGHAHGFGLHGHGGHGHGLHGHGHSYGRQPHGDYPLAYNRAAYDHSFHEYGGHGGFRTCPGGNCAYRFYGQPNLFGNYFTWNNCGAIPAALYVSPRPVPPHVGHTYITYQPLFPHEFMYTHHRTYHRYYNGGQGLNRTSVHYRYSPFGEVHF